MNSQKTHDDARQALSVHVASAGDAVFAKYGPHIGWSELLQVLADRTCVRYPCELRFDAGPLLPGEFAYPLPTGASPVDGFTLCVHPAYQNQPDRVAILVLYQLVRVNYGEFASCSDAEIFGAHALGLTRDEYYEAVCQLADQISPNKKSE